MTQTETLPNLDHGGESHSTAQNVEGCQGCLDAMRLGKAAHLIFEHGNRKKAAEALLAELEQAATPGQPASYEMDYPTRHEEGRWQVFTPGRTIWVHCFYPDGLDRVYERRFDDGNPRPSPRLTAVLTRDEALLLLAGHLAETVAVPL
ncbi:MAG: hypothetical protein A3E01_15180 [Gammaproteobacteria bacterium RIFCSPHIGHO2_12_FULL_63_22]|nr:MAG: hypothetical protein A3E01_15180 [Gammaproteobacteria bacterium RIFCSPHIGHO2_12_FULL_63_22]